MALAEELGLRLHQRDTFRNWDVSLSRLRTMAKRRHQQDEG